MEHSDIEHMAQGYPPAHIAKDSEEVIVWLATQLLATQEQRDALAAIAQRVIDTGELARPEHESLEAELCALAAQAEQTVSDARQDFEALIMLISRGMADVEKGINGYHDPQIQVFWENYQYSKGLCDEAQE